MRGAPGGSLPRIHSGGLARRPRVLALPCRGALLAVMVFSFSSLHWTEKAAFPCLSI